MAAHQMGQSSNIKPKVWGHQPIQAVYNRRQQHYEMWNSNAPNWYYYNGMPNVSSFTQYNHPQNQVYSMSGAGSSMQTTFSAYMPHYYAQQQEQSQNQLRNMQGQGQRQGQGQGQQQPSANTYSMAQMKPGSAVSNNPRSFYQTPNKPAEIKHAALSVNTSSQYSAFPLRTTTGSRQQEHSFISNLSSGSGSLNRIDSVSSFENNQGSRIRNSQHDMVEYRRIAARTLGEKERKKAEDASKQLKREPDVMIKPSKSVTQKSQSIIKQPKQQHQSNNGRITECDSDIQVVVLDEAQANKKRMKHRKTVNHNVVIEESLSTRGSSFFHKLGLFKGGKKSNIFSRIRGNPRTDPSCSSRSSSENAEHRHKSGKKIGFLKRLFYDDHNPTS
ncbi:hypothetical protein ACLKA7_002523 [Drosophila subpalustris]